MDTMIALFIFLAFAVGIWGIINYCSIRFNDLMDGLNDLSRRLFRLEIEKDGDVLTNGDVIKATFPQGHYEVEGTYVITQLTEDSIWVNYDYEWWNAPYRKCKKTKKKKH